MASATQHSAPLRGIALMVASAFFMNVNNAILKLLMKACRSARSCSCVPR